GGRPDPSEIESGEPKSRKRRLATTLVFTTIFFAGASFAAVAGDQLTPLLSSDGPMGTIASDSTTSTDGSADPAAPADAAAAPDTEAAPAPDTGAPADATAPADDGTTAPTDPAAAPTDPAAPSADATTDPNAPDAAPATADDGYAPSAGATASAPKGRQGSKAGGTHASDWK